MFILLKLQLYDNIIIAENIYHLNYASIKYYALVMKRNRFIPNDRGDKMRTQKSINPRTLYLNKSLLSCMDGFTSCPCTVVEAPMGYGKTTAVRELLKRIGCRETWQCVDTQGAADFWAGFCRALSSLDAALGDNLIHLGLPTDAATRYEFTFLIQDTAFSESVFLVVDDCHLIDSSEVEQFLKFFLKNLPNKMHLVLIARHAIFSDLAELRLKGYINYIGLEQLEFTTDDIDQYYRLCGIGLLKSDLDRLYALSEGWVSALYLFLVNYAATGTFTPAQDIQTLVYQAVYLPLSDELKDFLNGICLFDSFSLQQARYLWKRDNARTLLDQLLACNAFLTRERRTNQYHLHNLFSLCVREEFSRLPAEKQSVLLCRAGQWHLQQGEYDRAMEFFYRAKEFNLLLGALEKDKANSFTTENKEILIRYLLECPTPLLSSHPLSMLIFSKRLFGLNEPELFEKTCAATLEKILENDRLTEEERNNYIGEYEIIRSIACYNDITKMSQHHQKACELMTRESAIFDSDSMWTFSSPSVLYMYYRESGMLSEHLRVIKEAMPYYYQVTGGHGMGAETVMEAEVYYMRGDMENAEIHFHTALEQAKSKNQWSISPCAEFLQVRIALYRGNYRLAVSTLKRMRENMSAQKHYILLHTIDICDAIFYAQLSEPSKIPEWILNGDFANIKLLFPSISILQIVYGRVLLEKREYAKLIGLSDSFLETAGIFPNVLSQVYTLIHLAAAYEKLGHYDKSAEALKKALNIAMPDQLYLPFAENGQYVNALLQELGRFSGNATYAEFAQHCREFQKTYAASIQSIRRRYFEKGGRRLTERELEVARLAAKGFSNREIGERLFITENTVKARLKHIFEKLSLRSRVQLKDAIDKM